MATEVIELASDDVVVVENTTVEVIEVEGEDVVVTQETSVELVELGIQGPPGPKGDPGQAGVSYLTYLADGAIGGHRIVKTTEAGSVGYADSGNLADAHAVIGLTTGAAADGDNVNVQTSGEITEPSWNWTINQPVFLGANGLPTQTAPSTGFVVCIGVAIAPTKLILKIHQPLLIGA